MTAGYVCMVFHSHYNYHDRYRFQLQHFSLLLQSKAQKWAIRILMLHIFYKLSTVLYGFDLFNIPSFDWLATLICPLFTLSETCGEEAKCPANQNTEHWKDQSSKTYYSLSQNILGIKIFISHYKKITFSSATLDIIKVGKVVQQRVISQNQIPQFILLICSWLRLLHISPNNYLFPSIEIKSIEL